MLSAAKNLDQARFFSALSMTFPILIGNVQQIMRCYGQLGLGNSGVATA